MSYNIIRSKLTNYVISYLLSRHPPPPPYPLYLLVHLVFDNNYVLLNPLDSVIFGISVLKKGFGDGVVIATGDLDPFKDLRD